MDRDHIYDYIVELGGDCFHGDSHPPCQTCPFQSKCLTKIITLAANISKETRLQWALDELMLEIVLDAKE